MNDTDTQDNGNEEVARYIYYYTINSPQNIQLGCGNQLHSCQRKISSDSTNSSRSTSSSTNPQTAWVEMKDRINHIENDIDDFRNVWKEVQLKMKNIDSKISSKTQTIENLESDRTYINLISKDVHGGNLEGKLDIYAEIDRLSSIVNNLRLSVFLYSLTKENKIGLLSQKLSQIASLIADMHTQLHGCQRQNDQSKRKTKNNIWKRLKRLFTRKKKGCHLGSLPEIPYSVRRKNSDCDDYETISLQVNVENVDSKENSENFPNGNDTSESSSSIYLNVPVSSRSEASSPSIYHDSITKVQYDYEIPHPKVDEYGSMRYVNDSQHHYNALRRSGSSRSIYMESPENHVYENVLY